MKTKTNLLDVDYIGGQGGLTTDEEHALREYFRTKKLKTAKKERKNTSTVNLKKENAE